MKTHIDIQHLLLTKPQREWTAEEVAAVAAAQEALRAFAMRNVGLLYAPFSKKEGER